MTARAFVIGMGEVGRRIATAVERAGWVVHPVTRHHGWAEALDPLDREAARIVAVREEHLAAVLPRIPASLGEQLVLVQNGFLEPMHGPLPEVTRGLIYFTAKGDFFRVLCPSLFHGPQARRLAAALSAGGLPAEVLAERSAFLRAMIVKGIWNAVVGLPLAVHGVDLATYLRRERAELDQLADEGARAAGAEYVVSVPGQEAVDKLLETTAGLGAVRGGAKALPWRNGAIAWFGRRHGIPTPVNDRLLRAVGYDPASAPSRTPAS